MKKYQHIENKFDGISTKALLDGDIIIQPKLDGCNCQIYAENSEIIITSRNNILSEHNDNKNCYKTLIQDARYKAIGNGFTIPVIAHILKNIVA